MPLPEGYLPRNGDEVLIRARAKRNTDADGEGYFEIIGKEHHKFFMNAEEVHSLYRRQWNDGERVREIGDHEMVGPIVAIFEEWVWMKVDTGESTGAMLTFQANEIELAPEELPTMTEAELLAGLEPYTHCPPCDGVLGSQSVVSDDDPIASRDEAANR